MDILDRVERVTRVAPPDGLAEFREWCRYEYQLLRPVPCFNGNKYSCPNLVPLAPGKSCCYCDEVKSKKI
jgi:hypothetical protein